MYGVYELGKDGDWHFNMELFGAYLKREGIVWPLTEKGKLSTRGKTFENMTKGHPQLEALRQLRHARNKMRRIKLAVGADGRNRTVLWSFQSKSSRTQPKASQWIFFARGLAALTDQTRTGAGGRLRRLVQHGVYGCGCAVSRSRHARVLSQRGSLSIVREAGRRCACGR
jgi:hypothetical protein